MGGGHAWGVTSYFSTKYFLCMSDSSDSSPEESERYGLNLQCEHELAVNHFRVYTGNLHWCKFRMNYPFSILNIRTAQHSDVEPILCKEIS